VIVNGRGVDHISEGEVKGERVRRSVLTALSPNAEAVLEAFVGLGASDDLWAGAAHVHVLLALEDVTAIALERLAFHNT
jgi:hypothetical protein